LAAASLARPPRWRFSASASRLCCTEAHPRTTEEVGSYFTVTPNGLDALRAIGALHTATAIGFPTHKNVLWNDRGRRLGTIPLGDALLDGTASQTINRARLSRALQDEAIRRGVHLEFGKRLVDASTSADGRVVARFEDGTEATGDLLIGADGVHSVTRHIIDSSAPRGRYLGLVNFGGSGNPVVSFGANAEVLPCQADELAAGDRLRGSSGNM